MFFGDANSLFSSSKIYLNVSYYTVLKVQTQKKVPVKITLNIPLSPWPWISSDSMSEMLYEKQFPPKCPTEMNTGAVEPEISTMTG